MPEYICECCSLKTIDKSKYVRHLNTKKHKDNVSKSEEKTTDIKELQEEVKQLKEELYKSAICIEKMGGTDMIKTINDLRKENREQKEQIYEYEHCREFDYNAFKKGALYWKLKYDMSQMKI